MGRSIMYRKLLLEQGELLVFFRTVYYWTETLACLQRIPTAFPLDLDPGELAVLREAGHEMERSIRAARHSPRSAAVVISVLDTTAFCAAMRHEAGDGLLPRRPSAGSVRGRAAGGSRRSNTDCTGWTAHRTAIACLPHKRNGCCP